MPNIRKQRGAEIAATFVLKGTEKLWTVPSQSGKGNYTVDTRELPYTCTCEDFKTWNLPCKHVYAVQMELGELLEPTGPKIPKQKYKQKWPAYNAAQSNEKALVSEILYSLCGGIEEPPPKPGRPPVPLCDAVFAAVMKVYLTTSGRRAMTDMRELAAKGFTDKTVHYNSVFKTLENPKVTPILMKLIEQSALPLRAIETDFAVDSSGFSTSCYERWFDVRYNKTRSELLWLKAHIMVGVKTNIITAAEITESYVNDYGELIPLLERCAPKFHIEKVSADKAYIGHSNLQAIHDAGAKAFIPFKSNTTGQGSPLWEKTYFFFMFHRDEFLKGYHLRSNVETAFSMIKRKFGNHVRSKVLTAQINEILCKILCQNLCVLVQSMYEFGIVPEFRKEEGAA